MVIQLVGIILSDINWEYTTFTAYLLVVFSASAREWFCEVLLPADPVRGSSLQFMYLSTLAQL